MLNNYKVVWSDKSKLDLDEIFEDYQPLSEAYAYDLVSRILDRESQLSSFPFSGSIQFLPKLSEEQYRYLVEDNFKIIYHVLKAKGIVYIDKIFDTRRDPAVLNRELS